MAKKRKKDKRPLLERRLEELKRIEDLREQIIHRFIKIELRLRELRRGAARLGKRGESGTPGGSASVPPEVPSHATSAHGSPEDPGDIPGFLRRGMAAQAAVDDVIAAEQIRQEQEAHKKAKARGRIATMLAKKSGETRRMPLQGKEALRFIHGK